tara:strand:+ start:214 stop:369 length:156 start_codon:yes stop_codon:yes gene_type:complete
LNIKNSTPKYILELVKKHPITASGRKNHHEHHKRILKTIKLIKQYFKKTSN